MKQINLTVTCEKADWHLATTIADLQAQELSREDAEAFANFAFADVSDLMENDDGPGPHTYIDDTQWDRLVLTMDLERLISEAPLLVKYAGDTWIITN